MHGNKYKYQPISHYGFEFTAFPSEYRVTSAAEVQARIARNVFFLAGGFECQRHSNEGAEDADRDGVWRENPLPSGGWVRGGGCAPPRKFFCILSFKMAHFDAFWSTFYTNCNCLYEVKYNI